MIENSKKVFEMLGVKPYEKFNIRGIGGVIFYFDENLMGYAVVNGISDFCHDLIVFIISNDYEIVKLPKMKKLRDLTEEEYAKWQDKHCHKDSCANCAFGSVRCSCRSMLCWIKHKDLYSSKFLDQEIEIEE